MGKAQENGGMMKEKKAGGNVYRLPPCPSYDVEGMESWLTDMAGKGLVGDMSGGMDSVHG